MTKYTFCFILFFIPSYMTAQKNIDYKDISDFNSYYKALSQLMLDIDSVSERLNKVPISKAPEGNWVIAHNKSEKEKPQKDAISYEERKTMLITIYRKLIKIEAKLISRLNKITPPIMANQDSLKVLKVNQWVYDIRAFRREIESGLNEQELNESFVAVSKYKPTATVDVFLDQWEQLITKDFDDNQNYEIQDVFLPELIVMQNDRERFEPSFNNHQKKRFDRLYQLFETERTKKSILRSSPHSE